MDKFSGRRCYSRSNFLSLFLDCQVMIQCLKYQVTSVNVNWLVMGGMYGMRDVEREFRLSPKGFNFDAYKLKDILFIY